MEKIFDVLIVGAGPSGCSTAIFLGKSNKNVLLVDKEFFPRDKPCGDGISGKSIALLKEMGLIKEIEKIKHKKIKGVLLSSPNGSTALIDVIGKKEFGFVVKRKIFDNLLFENAKKTVKTLQGIEVKKIKVKKEFVLVLTKNIKTGKKETFNAKSVVFANGANCFAGKQFGINYAEQESQAIALRAYFENVKELNNKIEIHFVDELIPGYFWIFPISNNTANVGVGILSKYLKNKKIKLNDILFKIIKENPNFKNRFKNSKMVSKVKGWTLPLGGIKKRKIAFNRILFVGDAAGLIDPFTGEGIGNSLLSGKLASKVLLKAIIKNNFEENILKEFEKNLYNEIWQELSIDFKIQKILTNKFLINLAIKNVSKNKKLSKILSHSLLSETPMKDLFSLKNMKKFFSD